jgi:cytochrome c peroxidase
MRVAKGAALFEQMGCNACHAGSGWTRSQLSYEPGPLANGSVPFADPRPTIPDDATLAGMLGLLRTKQYKVPDAAPSAFGTPGTQVAFRVAPASTDAADTKLDYVFGQQKPAAGAPAPKPLPADQIQCALRAVGTFPAQTSADTANTVGVTVGADAPPVNEVRRILNAVPDAYKDALAFGANGFNIPSLVGLATGAPYFHAGNARSLEELFDVAFQGHYGAMGAAAPSSEDIRNLVSYLLSIDETPASEPVPPYRADLDLCAQFTVP